jgi:hypothetical protein
MYCGANRAVGQARGGERARRSHGVDVECSFEDGDGQCCSTWSAICVDVHDDLLCGWHVISCQEKVETTRYTWLFSPNCMWVSHNKKLTV